MKRMPEKPLYAEEIDKKAAVTFFSTLIVAAFFSLTVVNLAFPGEDLITRLLQAGCVIGSGLIANSVKVKMEKEHEEKVRVWLNYWDEYKYEMKKLEMEIEADCDEYTKETKKIQLESMKHYYDNNFY